MLAYSVITILVAVLFMLLGIAIYKGKTDLIHSYHQTKVADKAAYGKAFGKSLLLIAVVTLFSGIIGLVGDSDAIAVIAVAVLIVGIGVGIGCIFAVQRKYNKGVF